MEEEPEDIDKSHWLPHGTPIINEFRAQKADIAIDRSCDDCAGAGEINGSGCRTCKGRGRLLTQWRDEGLDPLSEVRFAQAQVRNILSYLHETRAITDQQAHDARTYEIWYLTFKAASTGERNELYGTMKRELAGQNLTEFGFVQLLNGPLSIDKQFHESIRYALFTPQTEHTRFIARRFRMYYNRVFDILGNRLGRIREEMDRVAARNEAQATHTPENDNTSKNPLQSPTADVNN